MSKKFSCLATALTAILAVGCVAEKEGAESSFIDREGLSLKFNVGGNALTKSSVKKKAAKETVRLIDLDVIDGQKIYLEESVEDLDMRQSCTAVTKGTPVFTESFGEMYHDIGAMAYQYGAGDITKSTELVDMEFTKFSDAKSDLMGLVGSASSYPLQYCYDFSTGIWPETLTDNLLFYLSAPVNQGTTLTGGVQSIDYKYLAGKVGGEDANNGAIVFTYTTPAAVADQLDIQFTTKSLDREAYRKNDSSESSILFYHALAGVKFKAGNIDGGITTITGITISGINNSGTCTVIPQYDNDGYQVTSSDYSNAAGTTDKSWDVCKWTNPSGTASYSVADLHITSAAEGQFPESFYASGYAENNFMDSDFSKVFFLMPQKTPGGAKITIKYTITTAAGGTKTYEKSIDFANTTWKAGKIYTYTLTARDIDVVVTDHMDDTKSTKSMVFISNTGNDLAYIRAAVVGNWFDNHADGSLQGKVIINHSWKNNININSDYWIEGTDGFYYYKYKVNPGVHTSYPIFGSYTTPDDPKNGSSHLEMDITVQAIDATKYGTTDWPWSNVTLESTVDDGTLNSSAAGK